MVFNLRVIRQELASDSRVTDGQRRQLCDRDYTFRENVGVSAVPAVGVAGYRYASTDLTRVNFISMVGLTALGRVEESSGW